jgi:hypothetical protein
MPWNIDGTFFSQYRSQLAWLFSLSLAAIAGSCSHAPLDMQKHLQEQLITAKPGAVIEVPEGKFHFDRTLSLTVDKVTLRGKGMDKTVLSFAGQKEGAQGLLVKANDFTIEDIGIEDSAGDALTVQGGTNIIIRRVRAEWTMVLTQFIRWSARICWSKIRWREEPRTRASTLGNQKTW